MTGGAVAVFRSAARAVQCALALQDRRALGIGLQVAEVRADDSVNVLNRSRLAGVVASVSAATAETAARDENGELARILGAHLQDEHDLEVDEEEVTELVESEA